MSNLLELIKWTPIVFKLSILEFGIRLRAMGMFII